MHPTPSEAPNPAIVFETLLATQRTAALVAAIQLDLFRAIGEGPADSATLAARCGASERGTRILCDYLAIMGLLQKNGGIYTHSPTSAAFLDPRSPVCLASISRFLAMQTLQDPLHHLADIVRNGRTSLAGDGSVEPDNPVWVEFARSMAPLAALSAPLLAEAALAGRSGPMRVLDIAAGHGLYGIGVAKVNPEARITALDWAAVLEVAEENAHKAGVADRFEKLPGSAFDVDFGGPYDLALVTNFLHHFSSETCTDFMRKVRGCLNPGGRAAILEFAPNDDRVSPPMAAGFSLTMLTTTAEGDAYTKTQLLKFCRDVGFTKAEVHPLLPTPQTAIIAEA
jgi:2-polyprenyl-3-methyl-5-hydroxy-6-metoxy-1,4-benzoquinol methylase